MALKLGSRSKKKSKGLKRAQWFPGQEQRDEKAGEVVGLVMHLMPLREELGWLLRALRRARGRQLGRENESMERLAECMQMCESGLGFRPRQVGV